ncbi:acyl-CoA thioesterase [Sphingomonas sp.]|uniref:acyl-CoA thioesterase n=1 Tax=Sphingomonas sp. TaxID=28214 RepID=UPI002DD64D90|nr:acyl-CoA thioesterase [Sphingomonas sp.]
MADDGGFRLCGLAVVHPWLCDAMGHLTTRHYVGMFDDASYQLFAMLGTDTGQGLADGLGWADVRHEIDYLDELRVGAQVRIEGRVVALGTRSVTSELRLLRQSDAGICARLTAVTVCFNLAERRAAPLPDEFRRGATALFALPGG